jgi:tetratricopeptide (TPR) repeat protein
MEEFGELIAFHYRGAVTGDDAELAWADDHDQREQIRGRAFEMQIRSGASARRRFAIDKALELHADALALAASNDERARAHDELGDDHEALFHGDDAVREYLAALDEAGATEVLSHVAAEEAELYGVDEQVDRAGALVAKAGRMVLRWGTFQEEPPLGRIQALVEASLRRRTTKRVRATLLMVYGGILPGSTGAPIAAGRTPVRRETLAGLKQRIESIESSLEIALQLDDPDLLYLGNELLGMAYQSAGEYAKMRRAAERQAALLDRLTSTRRQVDSLVSLASVRDDAGDFQAALEAAEDGFARAVSLSGHERMHIGYEVVAAAEQLGRWDRVAELFPWFAAASAAEGDITCPSVRAGPIYAAIVLCRRGEVSSAIEVLPIETAQQTVGTFITGAQLANYASLAGPADRALELTKRALESTDVGFVELGVVPLIEALTRQRLFDALDRFLPVARQQAPAVRAIGPAIERAEGVLALERGDRQSAEASLRRALQQFEELAMPFEVAQTQELTARVAGEVERLILLRESLARYESLGARPYAERVREQLAADRTAAI